jgi:negative regulator of flagellin synthesis FlgM
MKITHNKVGQNVNTTDAKAAEKSAEASITGAVKKNSKSAEAAEASAAGASSQATKVELSSRVQDIKKIREAAQNAPDVDAAKVEKFKNLIAEGKYKVDAKAIADKMVDEHLMTFKTEE